MDGRMDALDDLRWLLTRLLSVMQSVLSDRPDDEQLGPEWLKNEACALVSRSWSVNVSDDVSGCES